MSDAARSIGHAYLAITDHSPRLTIARGLSAERLLRQIEAEHIVNSWPIATLLAWTARHVS